MNHKTTTLALLLVISCSGLKAMEKYEGWESDPMTKHKDALATFLKPINEKIKNKKKWEDEEYRNKKRKKAIMNQEDPYLLMAYLGWDLWKYNEAHELMEQYQQNKKD